MASPERPSEEVIIEIGQQDRIILANAALDVVHMFDRTAEVQIGFQRLLHEASLEGLTDANAFHVPYETFRNIGRLLQKRLMDEKDMRIVRTRSDYVYRVLFDPDYHVNRTDKERSIRSLGYVGNSLMAHERHRGR